MLSARLKTWKTLSKVKSVWNLYYRKHKWDQRHLRGYNCWKTQAEKLHRTRMPTMLLLPVSFIGLRNFTEDLKGYTYNSCCYDLSKIYEEGKYAPVFLSSILHTKILDCFKMKWNDPSVFVHLDPTKLYLLMQWKRWI
jgi:hypothetical protein